MRRSCFIVLLVGLILCVGSPVMAGQGSPEAPVSLRISVNPLQGDAGAVIDITGSGAEASSKVVVTLAPQADSAAGALASVEVTPDPDGTFAASLTIPDDVA